jgi:hypothetical protein
MNASALRRFRRIAGIATAAIAGLLSLGLGAPAFAMIVPPPGETGITNPVAPVVKVVNTGVATWQVALIAAGAALAGAVVVLLATRLRPARRMAAAAAA